MDAQERKKLIAFARRLNKAAQYADSNEIELTNGGQVGSILASMADELAIRAGYHPTTEQR